MGLCKMQVMLIGGAQCDRLLNIPSLDASVSLSQSLL